MRSLRHTKRAMSLVAFGLPAYEAFLSAGHPRTAGRRALGAGFRSKVRPRRHHRSGVPVRRDGQHLTEPLR